MILHALGYSKMTGSLFSLVFTRVCTYVQRGSKLCFVVVVVVVLLLLGETLVRILNY
jgi:DMSO reductase anchor subunit